MRENKNKDKSIFFACLIAVITYFGYINLEHCKTDLDFLWFGLSLVSIIIASLLFYAFVIIPKTYEECKDDDFDGGRYWLSLTF